MKYYTIIGQFIKSFLLNFWYLRLGHLSDSGKFSLKKDGVSCIIFIFENQIMKGNADA
jgi:hypothetical protein